MEVGLVRLCFTTSAGQRDVLAFRIHFLLLSYGHLQESNIQIALAIRKNLETIDRREVGFQAPFNRRLAANQRRA